MGLIITLVVVLLIFGIIVLFENKDYKGNNQQKCDQESTQLAEKGQKELRQKKNMIHGTTILEQFHLGVSKDEILKIDKEIENISGYEFYMSESFSTAWAKELGINLPLQIRCILKKNKLWIVHISCLSTDRTPLYFDLLKFVNFYNVIVALKGYRSYHTNGYRFFHLQMVS